MGYVDADAHGIETETRTWQYFDPAERHYGPPAEGLWRFENFSWDPNMPSEDREIVQKTKLYEHERAFNRVFYPVGTRNLSNVPARLKHMDEMMVDAQVCFSNFWLVDPVTDVTREAALIRSWNRWAAEGTKPSAGRLKWLAHVPWRTESRAIEELAFAAKNGAVGIELTGYKYDIASGNPYWWPLYERAQDLNLTIAFHIGGAAKDYAPFPEDTFYRTLSRVMAAFNSLLVFDVPKKFPKLKFAFVEAGSSWVSWAAQSRWRSEGGRGSVRTTDDWRARCRDYLAETDNLYISCFMDDDINGMADLVGEDRLMLGTDYTHLDFGSDPDALRIMSQRKDISPARLTKLLDVNPRKCYGIPQSFRPTDRLIKPGVAVR